jgi:hypothetical protein
VQEQWYRWYGSDEKEKTSRVARLSAPPADFIPHLFQMDEHPFQAAVRFALGDFLGVRLHRAKNFRAKPDLRDPDTQWIELKDAAIKPNCPWKGEKGKRHLHEQVAFYARKFPNEQPSVLGFGLKKRWDQPGLRFHVLQPGFLRSGGSALRLVWDIPQEIPPDLQEAHLLKHDALFGSLLKHLAGERLTVEREKPRSGHLKGIGRINLFP